MALSEIVRRNIDRRILDLVDVLNQLRMPTVSSCQGHLPEEGVSHGSRVPYVVIDKELADPAALALLEECLAELGRRVPQQAWKVEEMRAAPFWGDTAYSALVLRPAVRETNPSREELTRFQDVGITLAEMLMERRATITEP